MSEEKITQIDDKCCLADAKTNEINVRRYSTGALDKRGLGKAQVQVQTRYRGNQLSSTHDLCKHGKRRDEELVIKPWKLVKKKNVESGDVSKPEKPLQVAKKDAVSEIIKSYDVKRSETKSTASPVVRKVKKIDLDVNKASKISENKSSKEDLLKNLKNKEKMKTDLDVKKVSRISEDKSSKEDVMKNLKNKEKKKTDEYVVEKTLYVVESSIEQKEKEKNKSIKSEIQQSSEKKILRGSVKKSLSLLPSDPRPIRQTTFRSQTALSEKKENGSANLVAISKTESKIKPKSIGLRATPPPKVMQVTFKKGKVLEPKQADSTTTLIKFKKRIVQEPKLISDEIKKKNLKVEGESVGDLNDEGKREKVVLKHRKVEEKKKLQTLYNNVIEETVNKLEEVNKSKVKALVGAFETVISLQENDKASHKTKIQRKYTCSKVVEG